MLDAEVAPAGGPLAGHATELDLAALPVTLLDEPDEGRVLLNGRETLERRTALPSVFQLAEGSVVSRSELLASGALPTGLRAARSKEARGRPVLIASGVTLLISGGMLVGAAMKAAEFERARDGGDADKIRRAANQNRGLALGSAGAAAVGVGLAGLGLSIAL